MTLFFVLNAKIFLPTLGQIFAVRKQSSFTLSNMTTAPSVTTSSLKTSIFSSPGSLRSSEGKSLKAGFRLSNPNFVAYRSFGRFSKNFSELEEMKKTEVIITGTVFDRVLSLYNGLVKGAF
jgi:hypothetical protein